MVLGNVREQRQSLKGSCKRREHKCEEQGEQGAQVRSREQERREQEQGAGAKGAGAKSRSGEHKYEEWGAQGARCVRAIGACTMLVAVRSAVEQALQQRQRLSTRQNN